jgi:hypothetical protein
MARATGKRPRAGPARNLPCLVVTVAVRGAAAGPDSESDSPLAGAEPESGSGSASLLKGAKSPRGIPRCQWLVRLSSSLANCRTSSHSGNRRGPASGLT